MSHNRTKFSNNSIDDNFYLEMFLSLLIIFCLVYSIIYLRCIYILCEKYNWCKPKDIKVIVNKNIIVVNPNNEISIGSNIVTHEVKIPVNKVNYFYDINELTINI